MSGYGERSINLPKEPVLHLTSHGASVTVRYVTWFEGCSNVLGNFFSIRHIDTLDGQTLREPPVKSETEWMDEWRRQSRLRHHVTGEQPLHVEKPVNYTQDRLQRTD